MAFIPLNLGNFNTSKEPLSSSLTKINDMIEELYTFSEEGDLGSISQNIVPDQDNLRDLGSIDKKWRSLYVSSNTIYLGNSEISVDNQGNLSVNGESIAATTWENVTGRPEIPTSIFNLDVPQTIIRPSFLKYDGSDLSWIELATVAESGSYNDLTNKPTIPSLVGYATETYVNNTITSLVDSAPTTLNTLNELAAALGDDPNFATTLSTQLGNKANSADLSLIATTGSYNDLNDKPSTVNLEISAGLKLKLADNFNEQFKARVEGGGGVGGNCYVQVFTRVSDVKDVLLVFNKNGEVIHTIEPPVDHQGFGRSTAIDVGVLGDWDYIIAGWAITTPHPNRIYVYRVDSNLNLTTIGFVEFTGSYFGGNVVSYSANGTTPMVAVLAVNSSTDIGEIKIVNLNTLTVTHTFTSPDDSLGLGWVDSVYPRLKFKYPFVVAADPTVPNSGLASGAVYIFNVETNQFVRKITNPATPSAFGGQSFGSVDFSFFPTLIRSIKYIVIGDYSWSGFLGRVYIYSSEGNLLHTIDAPGPGPFNGNLHHFGGSIHLVHYEDFTDPSNKTYAFIGKSLNPENNIFPAIGEDWEDDEGSVAVVDCDTGRVVNIIRSPVRLKNRFFGGQIKSHKNELWILASTWGLAPGSEDEYRKTYIYEYSINKPFTGSYQELLGKPTYNDLIDKPTIPSDISDLTDSGNLLNRQPSRTVVQAITGVLFPNQTANISITGFKSYAILRITTEIPAWVRIYSDQASRTADASRTENQDPAPGAGVLAEIITTTANQTILMTPTVIGFNNEDPVTNSIPIAVTNKGLGLATIGISLTILKLED